MNVVGGGIGGAIAENSIDFIKRFFPEGESVEDLFQELSEALETQDKRYLVVIDDIDRLSPDEALLIFRLVKSVGRLPNVIYLLAFDRKLAEATISKKYPSEGPHFLEKIIQAHFELPLPARDDLNEATLFIIEKICGPIEGKTDVLRFMNIFYDAISPYINIPRDLTRLSNSIAISWPTVAGEVDIADFVALEIMRLFEPELYSKIRTSKDRVCYVRTEQSSADNPEQELEGFLEYASATHRDNAMHALMRLFPRFERIGYSSDSIEDWKARRLVCTEKYFDIYFRMSIGEDTLSVTEVNEFIERCGDGEYVKDTFRKALGSIRKNGKSKVPLLFEEIKTKASRIEKEKFQSLISAIFEIADEICRDEDRERGILAIGDNYLRIHWLIRRLTFNRCTLDERSNIFLNACQDAQLGWLANFTESAVEDHFPHESKAVEPPEKCLVKKEHIPNLKTLAIERIEAAAANETLIDHLELRSILRVWSKLVEASHASVKAWTSKQLEDDKAVAAIARAFTGETWSQGMGMFGLGDRVAMRDYSAAVESLAGIFDIGKFRRRLEEIEKGNTLDGELKENVVKFLNAWRQQALEDD